MPLINSLVSNEINLYIWKIDECVDELILQFDSPTLTLMPNMKAESKKQEWLIERILIKQLLGNDVILDHESNGRPFLIGSHKNISISHTKGYLAIGIADLPHFGIDIEHYSERVNNITKHFLVKSEECQASDNATWHALIIWSAKESIFKAVNRGVVNVMTNSVVHPFKSERHGFLEALTNYEDDQYKSLIEYWCNEEYVLTVAKFQE